MTPQLRCVVLLAASPLALFLLHGAASRAARACGLRPPGQGLAALVVLATAPLTLAACWHFSWSLLPRAWLGPSLLYAATVYACLSYCYFQVYNLSDTGRRIRILGEFARGGAMTVEELERRYAPAGMLKVRLGRLVAHGQVTLEGGRYRLNSRALLAAALTLKAFRGVLGIKD